MGGKCEYSSPFLKFVLFFLYIFSFVCLLFFVDKKIKSFECNLKEFVSTHEKNNEDIKNYLQQDSLLKEDNLKNKEILIKLEEEINNLKNDLKNVKIVENEDEKTKMMSDINDDNLKNKEILLKLEEEINNLKTDLKNVKIVENEDEKTKMMSDINEQFSSIKNRLDGIEGKLTNKNETKESDLDDSLVSEVVFKFEDLSKKFDVLWEDFVGVKEIIAKSESEIQNKSDEIEKKIESIDKALSDSLKDLKKKSELKNDSILIGLNVYDFASCDGSSIIKPGKVLFKEMVHLLSFGNIFSGCRRPIRLDGTISGMSIVSLNDCKFCCNEDNLVSTDLRCCANIFFQKFKYSGKFFFVSFFLNNVSKVRWFGNLNFEFYNFPIFFNFNLNNIVRFFFGVFRLRFVLCSFSECIMKDFFKVLFSELLSLRFLSFCFGLNIMLIKIVRVSLLYDVPLVCAFVRNNNEGERKILSPIFSKEEDNNNNSSNNNNFKQFHLPEVEARNVFSNLTFSISVEL